MNLAVIALAAVQTVAPQCTGLSIRDETNPESWTFFGTLDPSARAAAVRAVQESLQAGPTSAVYWPPPLTAVERDIAALKARIGRG